MDNDIKCDFCKSKDVLNKSHQQYYFCFNCFKKLRNTSQAENDIIIMKLKNKKDNEIAKILLKSTTRINQRVKKIYRKIRCFYEIKEITYFDPNLLKNINWGKQHNRIINCFNENYLITINDLQSLSSLQLLNLKNLGKHSLICILNKMDEMNPDCASNWKNELESSKYILSKMEKNNPEDSFYVGTNPIIPYKTLIQQLKM